MGSLTVPRPSEPASYAVFSKSSGEVSAVDFLHSSFNSSFRSMSQWYTSSLFLR